ncbi:transcription antitermination factor NusB [Phenylobacterium sp. SCN 70-31]|uniref:transcription antitermination factor NusB n=1 Tax=Phenylobacterium sp. SCN 70-31 TaxID=1660129 RepID=UPI00086B9E0A|nr:transcription antitermination factor NusB [Phenylobacterium sp. SCN 70-31]ODT85233.1 MAG: transcription antitermination factor NusB [Phenylobacterium sp. SCN 70-31]
MSGHASRSVARLAAVQALYQMEVSAIGVEAVIREFTDHRFDRDIEGVGAEGAEGDGATLASADEGFFADLVRGVVAEQARVDAAIAKRLAEGWRLERLDATVRAILRAGAFELARRPDVPTEVAIDEYVEVAKSFFEGTEPGFVNGALDGVAKDVRPARNQPTG